MKHVVGFSGGIDSQACALWVRQRFPAEDVILLNSQAGQNESPHTVDFVDWYSKNVFPVIVVTPIVADMVGKSPGKIAELGLSPTDELTFPLLAKIKQTWPSATARFCTQHLKLEPQRRWLAENVQDGWERYIGVRRDESDARKDVQEKEWDDYFDCWLHRPLAAWTKWEAFDFVLNAGEKTNPLYAMGFNRVGCAPCIFAPKGDILNWSARQPEMIDKIRRWEKETGRTYFSPRVPGMEINFIDDIVAWSKTERGGKQISLPFYESEVGTCVSKYGLCE